MKRTVLLGRGAAFVEIPQTQLENHLAKLPERHRHRLDFISTDHQRVRNYAVTQLARVGSPISPELIHKDLNIGLDRVNSILADLEKNLFFLVRNENGAVSWAFPLTSDPTPHRLHFSTGENIYAA